MAEQVRRKISISVTLSPNLVKQMDEAIDSGDFAGQSDVISQALSEFFTRYYERKKGQAQKSELTRPVTIE